MPYTTDDLDNFIRSHGYDPNDQANIDYAKDYLASHGETPAPATGLIAGTGQALARGVAGVGEAAGNWMQDNPEAYLGNEEPSVLNKAGEWVSDKSVVLKDAIPRPYAGESKFKEDVFGGTESIPLSAAFAVPGIAGGVAGGAIGGPLGATAGRVAGAAAGTAAVSRAMFASTRQQTLEELDDMQAKGLLRDDVTPQEKIDAATAAAHAEWEGEMPSSIVESLIYSQLPAGKVLSSILKPGMVQLAKNVGMSLPLEVGGEMGTSKYQAEAMNTVLKPEYAQDPNAQAIAAIGPTLFQTGVMNVIGVGGQRFANSHLANAMADTDVSPDKRLDSAIKIAEKLKESHGEDVATNFLSHATDAINNRQEVDINNPDILSTRKTTPPPPPPPTNEQAAKDIMDASGVDEAISAMESSVSAPAEYDVAANLMSGMDENSLAAQEKDARAAFANPTRFERQEDLDAAFNKVELPPKTAEEAVKDYAPELPPIFVQRATRYYRDITNPAPSQGMLNYGGREEAKQEALSLALNRSRNKSDEQRYQEELAYAATALDGKDLTAYKNLLEELHRASQLALPYNPETGFTMRNPEEVYSPYSPELARQVPNAPALPYNPGLELGVPVGDVTPETSSVKKADEEILSLEVEAKKARGKNRKAIQDRIESLRKRPSFAAVQSERSNLLGQLSTIKERKQRNDEVATDLEDTFYGQNPAAAKDAQRAFGQESPLAQKARQLKSLRQESGSKISAEEAAKVLAPDYFEPIGADELADSSAENEIRARSAQAQKAFTRQGQENQDLADQIRDDIANRVRGARFQLPDGSWTGYKSTDDWMSQKNAKAYYRKKYGKTTFADKLSGLITASNVNSTLDTITSDKALTPTQKNVWEYLKATRVKEIKENNEDIDTGLHKIEKEGIELKGAKDTVVAEFNKGDKIAIDDHGVPDLYTHMGHDGEGNVVLKDGDTKLVDDFDTINVIGYKKNSKSVDELADVPNTESAQTVAEPSDKAVPVFTKEGEDGSNNQNESGVASVGKVERETTAVAEQEKSDTVRDEAPAVHGVQEHKSLTTSKEPSLKQEENGTIDDDQWIEGNKNRIPPGLRVKVVVKGKEVQVGYRSALKAIDEQLDSFDKLSKCLGII